MQSGTVNLVVFKSSFLSVHYIAGMALNRLGDLLPRIGKNNLSNIVFWLMMLHVYLYFHC